MLKMMKKIKGINIEVDNLPTQELLKLMTRASIEDFKKKSENLLCLRK